MKEEVEEEESRNQKSPNTFGDLKIYRMNYNTYIIKDFKNKLA